MKKSIRHLILAVLFAIAFAVPTMSEAKGAPPEPCVVTSTTK